MRRLKVGQSVTHKADSGLRFIPEYVLKYANKDAVDEAGAESDDDDDMSSVGSFGDEDEEPAGTMEEV
jgi:ubiquitin-conjugating enzyme E2 H